jgi:hypothetical protein
LSYQTVIDPLNYGSWSEIATPDGKTGHQITTVLLGKKSVIIRFIILLHGAADGINHACRSLGRKTYKYAAASV